MSSSRILCVIAVVIALTLTAAGIRAGEDPVRSTVERVLKTSTALEAYCVDEMRYPSTGDAWVEVGTLADQLQPTYIRELPTSDGWGHAILVRATDTSYRIVSPGADGEVERDWSEIEASETRQTTGPTDDIVWGDGVRLSWPERPPEPDAELRGQQRATADTISDIGMILLYAWHAEHRYIGPTDGLVRMADMAETIAAHPDTDASPEDVPTEDVWGNPLLYWSDTEDFRIVSTGPDGVVCQDWITDTEPADPDCEDIVFKHGGFILEPPVRPVW